MDEYEKCKSHRKSLVLFCRDCKIVMCHECQATDTHRDHDYWHVDSEGARRLNKITNTLDLCRQIIIRIDVRLALLETDFPLVWRHMRAEIFSLMDEIDSAGPVALVQRADYWESWLFAWRVKIVHFKFENSFTS